MVDEKGNFLEEGYATTSTCRWLKILEGTKATHYRIKLCGTLSKTIDILAMFLNGMMSIESTCHATEKVERDFRICKG